VQAGAFFPKGAVMTNQEIFELMARFDASTATTLKLSTKDFSLELGKGGPAAPPFAALLADGAIFQQVVFSAGAISGKSHTGQCEG